jgi:hypothetical protein
MNQAEWNAKENGKDRLEMAGARARFRGAKRNENPYLSKSEREMAIEFPDTALYFNSNENTVAYYWELGWENYQDWADDLKRLGKI